MSLRISACRSLCDWGPTRALRGAEPLFACTGCGSQWVPSEPWTPRQADGAVPDTVRAARALVQVPSGVVTEGRGAAAAGSAGS